MIGTAGLLATFVGFWLVCAGALVWLNSIFSVFSGFREGRKEGGSLKGVYEVLFPGMKVRISMAIVVIGIFLVRSQTRRKKKVQ
jgi:hypothetical protein